jgi:hypothetical protein
MIAGAARVALRDARGCELQALLAPLTAREFVHDYWAKKPLFVKGFAEKYAGFFDAETFSRAISPPGPFPDEFLRASFDRKSADGTSAPPEQGGGCASSVFRAQPDQAFPLFAAGATLCVSQIETRVPSLVPFLAAVKRQLGYPGKVCFNAYLSPPGSGFNWHFDSRIASTLQIEGTKRWRFSKSVAVPWPRGNGTLRSDGSAAYSDPNLGIARGEHLAAFDPADVGDVMLEPGDLLILPAGLWHEACGGTGGSLALNLSFNALSYTQIVRRLLDALLAGEPDWRSPAPLLPGDEPGEADPAGLAAITAQLGRAAHVLGALRGDSAAVVKLWESLVQNPDPALAPPSSTPARATEVLPDARLRLRSDGSVYPLLADGGARLCIAVGASRTIELTGAAIGFGQRLLTQRSFVARESTGWNALGPPFEWPEVAALLRTLKAEGLIEDDVATG